MSLDVKRVSFTFEANLKNLLHFHRRNRSRVLECLTYHPIVERRSTFQGSVIEIMLNPKLVGNCTRLLSGLPRFLRATLTLAHVRPPRTE